MELHERIRIAREARGLSRKELAAAVGKSEQAVRWWESGTNRPRHEVLLKLGEVLACSFDGGAAAVDWGPLSAEDVALALAISRLPREYREAIATLVRLGGETARLTVEPG